MNRSFLILHVLLLTVAGCSKHADSNTDKFAASSKALPGTWTFKEYYFSIGGPGSWRPVRPSGQTITFMQDGTFKSTASFSNSFNRYELLDSGKIRFTPAATASGYVLMHYQFDKPERTLILSPIEPMCIEGCSTKFVR